MGKVRRARQKAHTAAVKTKQDKQDNNQLQNKAQTMHTDMEPPQLESSGLSSSLFQGVDLKKYTLTTNLPDLDAQSAITSKSLKELKMKKKDKRKLRHELWMKKLSALDLAKKEEKDRKKKQQTPVVGDIGALGDALPTLELLLKQPKQDRGEKKVKGIQKEKKRKKQMMEDISVFHKVLQHPAFQENPTATISEHLQNRHKLEDMQS